MLNSRQQSPPASQGSQPHSWLERGRWLPLLLSVLWVCWAFFQLQPVLRESDQATLLHGGLQLATEKKWQLDGYALGDESGRPFYRVGTFWGAYFFNGVWLWLLDAFEILNLENVDPDKLLLWTNGLAAAVMSLGVLSLGLAMSRKRQDSAFVWVAWLGFLLTPTILLSAPLTSPNALSVGFLLMLVACFVQKPQASWPVLKALLSFLAVACRADALLVLPILCWAQLQPMSWRALFARQDFWWMGFASLLALGLGMALGWGNHEALFPPLFLKLEAIAAFLVFGLGVSLLLLLVAAWRLLRAKAQKLWVRLVGLLLLFLPLGFYSVQLYSPRHLMVVAVAALIPLLFIPSSNQAKTKQTESSVGKLLPVPSLLLSGLVILAGLLPLFVGLLLPRPKNPQLTWTQATRYPTTDGLWPMGALLNFQLDLRSGEIDHYKQIWADALSIGELLEAKQVETSSEQSKTEVYFDKTNQLEVYALVGKMQGWQARILSAEQALKAKYPVLFERGDLQINKNWYAQEDNPHAQLPAWKSGRWAAGMGEGLLQLLPSTEQVVNSSKHSTEIDWLPITLRPFFAKARFSELHPSSYQAHAQEQAAKLSIDLPEHLSGATLVLALEDGRAWNLGPLKARDAKAKLDLSAAKQVYTQVSSTKLAYQQLSWSQTGLKLELSWRQATQTQVSKPRVFVRQFADYMRY